MIPPLQGQRCVGADRVLGKVCVGAGRGRRSCFLRSDQHEDASKAGLRVSVQGLVLEQVSA